MNTRSKKNDTKLADVRGAVAEKELEVALAKKQSVQHDSRADHIEVVTRRQQEEVARLSDDIDSLLDALESAPEWREDSKRQDLKIRDLK